MDEEFDRETDRMLQEALAELEEGDDNGNEEHGTENEGAGDESDESGSEHEEEREEEDDNGTGGDGHEDEHQNEQSDKFSPIEVEVAGHKVTINSKEEMLAYIKKGAETFTKKPDTLVEEKTVIEQAGLTADDLKLIADAKAGSKEAIALIAKRAGVDILDVENEMAESYKTQHEYYTPTEVDTVANEILSDAEHSVEFKRIASSLPPEFMTAVTSNARDLKAFSNHIKSGIAQKVIPLAINEQILNGGSFIENYNKVGARLATEQQKPQPKREMSEREEAMRKRASSGAGNNHKREDKTDKDIWEMTDEEFAKLDISSLK